MDNKNSVEGENVMLVQDYITKKLLQHIYTHTFCVVHIRSSGDKKPSQSNQQSHNQIHHNPGLENLVFRVWRPEIKPVKTPLLYMLLCQVGRHCYLQYAPTFLIKLVLIIKCSLCPFTV